jgi:hypothetical protein
MYVERDGDGRIVGVYANPQPGRAEEWVEGADIVHPTPPYVMPLILNGILGRLEALEAGAPPQEDAPGEQPNIYDDEETDEAAPQDDHDHEPGQAGADGDGADAAPAYAGIAILPDELGARRNAVLASITAEKLTRLSIAMDPSRADFLASRFADYQNAGALGIAIDDGLLADRDAFLAMKDRTDRITAYALSLERAAVEADADMLAAMHAGLGDGWP